MCSATSLLCDRIYQISYAKTYVFADSVPCLGGMKEKPNEAWKEKIKWYFEPNHLKNLNRIGGESVEFGWKIFPGFTTFGLHEQIQEFMKERQRDPEQFEGRIIFMSMFNDIIWGEKGNEGKCEVMLTKLRIMLADFLAVIGHSWDLDPKRNGSKEFGTKLLFSDSPSDIPCFQRP